MCKVLSKLMQCKYAWPFKAAVSEDDAPDYTKIIQVCHPPVDYTLGSFLNLELVFHADFIP